MDMQSQMTRPYGHNQEEEPIRIHHLEEEEHHEKGATKVLKKVKEKAKKIKNSLTKHGHGHEHDVDEEEDDEYDEQDPEVHGAPVYESSAVRGGVTGQPESLSHPGESNVPAPEEIIPPGTKVFPVVTSDYTRPVEPEPLYGHEALTHPARNVSEKEERREAPSHPLRVFDMSEREENREAHHMPMDTPVSLLSATEDVTRTFAPGEGGQRKVNIERPKGLEEDTAAPGGGSDYLSGVSNYQSKVTAPTREGGGEAGVPGIAESLGRMKVTDESSNRKSGRDFERDYTTRSHDFGLKDESGIGKDSPAGFGGESGPGLEKDLPTGGFGFDRKTESGIDKDSPKGLGTGSIVGLGGHFPTRNEEFDQKTDSGINKSSPTGLGSGSIAGLREDFPARSHGYDQTIESLIEPGFDKDSPMEFVGESGAGLGEEFPTRSHELRLKNESGINKSSPTGIGSGSIAGMGEDFPARSQYESGLKTESGINKNSPMGFVGESGTGLGEDLSHELGLKNESGIDKNSPGRGSGSIAGLGEESEFPARSLEYGEESKTGPEQNIPVRSGDMKAESGLGKDLPTGTHDQFSPELSPPKARDDFDSKTEGTREAKPSTYTEKIASATSAITDKAIAAKNAVASKLGYSGESGGGGQYESPVGEETPRSATGYGQKVAGTVAEKLTPVYEKVKDTGSNVMTKLPLSGGGSGAETGQVEDKGVSTGGYLAGKLRPGEEDKVLSEVIAEKLHLGGGRGEKKTTTTKEVEVTVEKIPTDKLLEEMQHGEAISEEGKGGMVGKLKGAVTSWLGGSTAEGVKPKSSDSVEESSQSLGSTVGTMGFSDSAGAVSNRGLQESGN